MKTKHNPFLTTAMAGMLAVCTSCGERQAMPPGGSYDTMTVSLSDITLYTDYPATVSGRQDVDIYPQISGLITQVCIKEGAKVAKGQTMFVIDQTPYKAALETALANVESAEASVATAQMSAGSKEALYKENVVSLYDLQTAQNTLRSAKASLAQAMAELTVARNNLSYTEIKSPVSGTAGMTPYRIGAYVSPSVTSPLVSVSDNEQMYVYFSVSEKQMLSMMRSGGSPEGAADPMPEVTLLLSDGSEYPEKGRIDAVSGIVDKATGSVSMRASFPNPDHILRSGSTGKIRIPTERKGCIVIPQAATYEIQDRVFVYKIVDGRTQAAQIGVFPRNNGSEYIVESGLEEGEEIIAGGAGLLRSGIQVRLQPERK
ncbi:MAG: efflux RND transporter periplasmic adaptor subunit [Candidatus Cryptobacteroides sp.]